MRKLGTFAVACAAALIPMVAWAAATPPYLGVRGKDCSGQPATIISGPEAGEDVIGTEGDDVVIARGARKVIRTLGGNDTVCFESTQGGAVIDAGPGDDLVWVSGDAADEISGGLGDDRLHGNNGDDRLLGDEGRDSIFSGAGNDSAYGGDGDDELNGGTQDDFLSGDAGMDLCDGDHGDDSAWACEQHEQMP